MSLQRPPRTGSPSPVPPLFPDRRDAGRRLARQLRHIVDPARTIVLALPRGGVPIGAQIAAALDIPLDVLVVRKLGVPGHEELALGALASGGATILNDDVIGELGIGSAAVAEIVARERAEIERREARYRNGRPLPAVFAKTIVLVDDGLATGATMRAGVAALRRLDPARIVVAVPVAARDTAERLRVVSDALVCLAMPEPFYGVGMWYQHFSQLGDDEVCALLEGR